MSAFSFFIRTSLKVIIILLPLVYYEWFEKYINIVIIVFIIVFFIVQYLLVYKPIKNISNTRKSILDFLFKNWVEGARLNRKRPKIRISIATKVNNACIIGRPVNWAFFIKLTSRIQDI